MMIGLSRPRLAADEDWPGSIRTTGLATPLDVVPLPTIDDEAMDVAETPVLGPSNSRPPWILEPIIRAEPLSMLPPLTSGVVVPTTWIDPWINMTPLLVLAHVSP